MGIVKGWQVKVAGERVFIGYVECVQECKGCLDRVLKDFLLSNLINCNYFLRKNICINTSPCYQGPQCFLCVL